MEVGGKWGWEMIEDSFSGNREDSGEGGWPQWKHGQKVWEYQREGVLECSEGKELPDREEKSRQLNGLNNVLLTAEMRSTEHCRCHGAHSLCRIMQHGLAVAAKFTGNFRA